MLNPGYWPWFKPSFIWGLALVACVLGSTDARSNACEGGEDPVDLSENFDILNGERRLIVADDLLVTCPRLSNGTPNPVTGQPEVWNEWGSRIIGLPTTNGDAKDIGLHATDQDATDSGGLGGMGGNPKPGWAATQTRPARLFETKYDQAVQMFGKGKSTDFTSVQINLRQMDVTNKNWTNLTFQTVELADFGLTSGSLLFLTVDDFDRDGYQDLLFSVDGATWLVASATDVNDPTQGVTVTQIGDPLSRPIKNGNIKTGDLNGDGIVDVTGIGEGGGAENPFAGDIVIFQVCPGDVSSSTTCAGKQAFEIVPVVTSVLPHEAVPDGPWGPIFTML